MNTNAPLTAEEVRAMRVLTSVFTPGQIEQLTEAAQITRDNAILRGCSQSFEVEINDKGYVRYFHYRQSVTAVKPTTYKPE